jgi:hypothetical protein
LFVAHPAPAKSAWRQGRAERAPRAEARGRLDAWRGPAMLANEQEFGFHERGSDTGAYASTRRSPLEALFSALRAGTDTAHTVADAVGIAKKRPRRGSGAPLEARGALRLISCLCRSPNSAAEPALSRLQHVAAFVSHSVVGWDPLSMGCHSGGRASGAEKQGAQRLCFFERPESMPPGRGLRTRRPPAATLDTVRYPVSDGVQKARMV